MEKGREIEREGGEEMVGQNEEEEEEEDEKEEDKERRERDAIDGGWRERKRGDFRVLLGLEWRRVDWHSQKKMMKTKEEEGGEGGVFKFINLLLKKKVGERKFIQ